MLPVLVAAVVQVNFGTERSAFICKLLVPVAKDLAKDEKTEASDGPFDFPDGGEESVGF